VQAKCDDSSVRTFVYTILPASLIPEAAEYIFESAEELEAGDEFERAGRRLLVERVEEDEASSEPASGSISRTLHCREVEADVW
jgi:hypothetical protein